MGYSQKQKKAVQRKVLDLIIEGKDLHYIADKLGICKQTVGKHRRSLGIRSFREMTGEKRKAQIIKFHAQGMKREDMAGRLGCSIETVDNYRRELGLMRAIRQPVTEATKDEVWYLSIEEGLNQKQIAARIGLDSSTVGKIIRSRKRGGDTPKKKGKSLEPEASPEFGAANRLLMQSWGKSGVVNA